MSDNTACMCLWNESVAGRGASEVCSCLLKVLSLLPPSEKEKDLIIWSDACGSQNRNWYTISLWLLLFQKGLFKSIQHQFMVSGHSFLPADRDFALIERAKKTASVNLPDKWSSVISQARVKNPFTVVNMKQQFFQEFETLTKALKKPKNLKLHGIQAIKIDEEGMLKIKRNLEDASWKHYRVLPSIPGKYTCSILCSHSIFGRFLKIDLKI